MRKAIQVSSNKGIQILDLDAPNGALEVLQKAVGGYVEVIDLHADLQMWCNEEGKMKNLPVNRFATQMWREHFAFSDIIVGDVVFTGGVDAEGETHGLTDTQVELLRTIVAS